MIRQDGSIYPYQLLLVHTESLNASYARPQLGDVYDFMRFLSRWIDITLATRRWAAPPSLFFSRTLSFTIFRGHQRKCWTPIKPRTDGLLGLRLYDRLYEKFMAPYSSSDCSAFKKAEDETY